MTGKERRCQDSVESRPRKRQPSNQSFVVAELYNDLHVQGLEAYYLLRELVRGVSGGNLEDLARTGETWRDLGRTGETWRDLGRIGENW